MKVVRIHAFGGADQLQLEEAPQPQPQAGQVLARVHAAGVNPVDWKIREGRFGNARGAFPMPMGQDFAGVVVALGSDVASVKPGDRVFGFANGAYAEFVTAAADEIVPCPERLSDEAAAGLPTPGVTAYQVVHRAARLQPGQSVLIHGSAGAVGSIAVQLARIVGARVAGTVAGEADVDYVRGLGAETVINTRSDHFDDRLAELDAVIDLVGGDLQARSYPLLKPGGVLVTTIGAVDEEQARRRQIRAVRFVMTRDGADLRALAELFERGQLRTRTAKVLPFDQARQAQELTQSGAAHGKVILRVA